jgi:signal transduction histidine kinase
LDACIASGILLPTFIALSMQQFGRSVWVRYGAAIAAVGVTLGVKLLLRPIISQDAPFLLFFAAVLIAAWIGGLGPGLLATALATVFNGYFFMQPFNQFAFASADQVARLMLSALEGVCISVICTKLQSARQRAEESEREARELERRILEISDAEQRRIGYDLHDGLGQHLTGIALMTRQLENRLTAEQSPHAARAVKISGLADTAVEWTHNLTRSLSPPALEKVGLAEALQELAANAENIFNIQCSFERDGQTDIRDLAAAVHLYRIAQEAISNAVKHGNAAHIRLRLSDLGNEIHMQIIDDGSGIQPANNHGEQDGMGLRIMQYRARMIGAQIDVQHRNGESQNQSGTVVTCRYRSSQNDTKLEA